MTELILKRVFDSSVSAKGTHIGSHQQRKLRQQLVGTDIPLNRSNPNPIHRFADFWTVLQRAVDDLLKWHLKRDSRRKLTRNQFHATILHPGRVCNATTNFGLGIANVTKGIRQLSLPRLNRRTGSGDLAGQRVKLFTSFESIKDLLATLNVAALLQVDASCEVQIPVSRNDAQQFILQFSVECFPCGTVGGLGDQDL